MHFIIELSAIVASLEKLSFSEDSGVSFLTEDAGSGKENYVTL